MKLSELYKRSIWKWNGVKYYLSKLEVGKAWDLAFNQCSFCYDTYDDKGYFDCGKCRINHDICNAESSDSSIMINRLDHEWTGRYTSSCIEELIEDIIFALEEAYKIAKLSNM